MNNLNDTLRLHVRQPYGQYQNPYQNFFPSFSGYGSGFGQSYGEGISRSDWGGFGYDQ